MEEETGDPMNKISNTLSRLKKSSLRKNNLKTQFFTVFTLLFLFATLSGKITAQTTEVINQTTTQGWVFYDDETDKIDPTLGTFVNGPATPPAGTGSVQFSVSGTQRKNIATYQFSGTVLADITEMKYSTYNPSAGNGGSANRSGYLNFNVDFDGSDTWQRRMIFVPSDNGSITQDSWQEWDTINGGTAVWRYSGGNFPGTANATMTWADILATYPGVRMRVTDSFWGIRVGEPYADGYTENIDAIKFGTAGGTTTYDFEQTSSITVSPATAPNFVDNDYTRINNAVQAIASGGTITLDGTFDWTETNAAASWALGSNQQTGGGLESDDYSILAPNNLNGVTVTAATLGDATIEGPGDLATLSLEGVFQFYTGTNQNWTISNLRFLDIDNPIGFYFVGGGTNVYDGTQILNNYIRLPQDLNATVAPNDNFQNIGLHYSFGDNILISGNTFDVAGDSVSDSANLAYATNIAMQSNTSGGAYEGLQITNNTINVLNAQSADPEVIIGIWENGHGHTKNITVSGNQFLNADAGNDPSVNLQRGFRLTSHSSATTTIAYSNNRVEGANIGFQWLAGQNFAAHQPIVLTNNVVLNGDTGFKVDSDGSADMSFNRIVGNSTAGVENATTGTVTAENNWWGCNYGPGAGGAGCAGTANGTIGTVDADPWLVLTTAASPSSIDTAQTSAITSQLIFNSDSVDTSGSGIIPDATPANFAAMLGTVSPTMDTTTAGTVNTTFTPSPTMSGAGGVDTTIDGQTVNAPVTIAFSCNEVSIATGTTVKRNTQFLVPVTIDDTTGRGIISYDFTTTFDPSVVAFIGAENAGTLSSGLTITTNTSSGTIVISGFGTTPISGAGTLLNLRFIAVGGITTTSPLNFSSFTLNGGTPCVNTTNGDVTVEAGDISGQVTYVNSSSPPVPVPDVNLNAVGSVNVSNMTDSSGNYSLTGFGTGAYTVTPSKASVDPFTDPNTAITSFDAARIAQHVVGFITLNANQLIAADVSGDNVVSSFDSALIAQTVVGIPNPSSTGDWVFVPSTRSYPNVETDYTGQDYDAILKGEVSGEWMPPSPLSLYSGTRKDESAKDEKESGAGVVNVTAPTKNANASMDFVIPIEVDDTSGEGIISVDARLTYDPAVILPQINACSVTGTISSGALPTCNTSTPGLIIISLFTATPLNSAGVLVNLNFTAVGAAGTSSPLTFTTFTFNGGVPNDVTNDGRINIVGPTAAGVSVGGKVLSARGRSISNAFVTITDVSGATRMVRVNQFGYYRFEDVEVGQTYTATVSSKGYSFTPQAISVTDSVNNFNLIADPQ